MEAQFCRPRNPRSNWNVKGNRDFCSKAKSTHDLNFSPSPQKVDRTPAHIPKRIAEIRVLPTRDCGLKRPFGLSDRNQVSVSKKPRRMVSIHWSPRRMLQGYLFLYPLDIFTCIGIWRKEKKKEVELYKMANCFT